MNVLETVPTTWEVVDEQFFRIVAHVLDCQVLEAASVLLSANDPSSDPS